MKSTFSELISELAKQIPMAQVDVHGEEFRRVAILTPKKDGKERMLCWRGADPESTEYPEIVKELIEHLCLNSA